MPAFSATSPGKIILFGEHAVVYGEPAIAIPVMSAQTKVIVSAHIQGKPGEIRIEAPDISLSSTADQLEPNHPLRAAIQVVIGNEDLKRVPSCTIQVNSEIPPSSGLGSSAAISVSLIRAFSAFLGKRLSDEQVSDYAYVIEKIHHGTPSGIDNTVISHQKPVYYRKGDPFEILEIGEDFSVLIVNSGIPGRTREAVDGVRERWQREPDRYNQIFTKIGDITQTAKAIIERGNTDRLGDLMNENHELLQEIGVSTPELDRLATAAREVGALGAKLSGGGLGGHIIALVKSDSHAIREEMVKNGAISTLITPISNRGLSKNTTPNIP
jgi:mevalonate kinase